jgi:Leucine-rich repeat (LRR) protein
MKRRALLQFRLWHLIVVMTICCVFLAWVVALRQRASRQAAALRLIHMEGGTYDDAADTPPWREWLAGGPVDRTLTVRFQRRHPGDIWGPYGPDGGSVKLHTWSTASFPAIGRALNDLPGITVLDFHGTRLRGHTPAIIPNSPRLFYLSLGQTGVRSADLEVLARVPNVRQLYLRRTSIDDDGLLYLTQLSRLEWLDLGSTDVTDAGMVEVGRLTNLKTLRLENTQLTDKGLAALQSLRNLEELDLGMTLVSPQSSPHLNAMQVHGRLIVPHEWPRLAVESLKQFLPATCEVSASPYRLQDRPDAKALRLGGTGHSP